MAFSSVFSILLKFPLLMIIMVNDDEEGDDVNENVLDHWGSDNIG